MVKQQVEEIERLRADNKRLMILLEQQNQIILNSQELQKKALNNTELYYWRKEKSLKEELRSIINEEIIGLKSLKLSLLKSLSSYFLL